MYVQFYNSNTEREESALEVRRSTGLNFETAGPEALAAVGVFPISRVNQPFNVKLYDIVASWDTSTGYAVKSWTPTAKTLADVIEGAKRQRINTIVGRIRQLRRASGYGSGLLRAADGIDDSIRPARFDAWVDRINAAVTTLDTELTSIEGAATVDAINDIVSPAHGTVKLALDSANPLNLLAGDFKLFLSKNYTESDMELYFPGTATTVAYSSGFAATASAVTATDKTVQIRVASTGVVVDEFELNLQDASQEVYPKSFGFLRYQSLDLEPDIESFIFNYTNTDPTEFAVTVSGGDFYIDGVQQDSLTLTQGQVYRFDQSDASNSGHPLRIYSDADKTFEVFARVVAVGTPGSAGAYTEYMPGAAGNFSYQCSVHSGMGGSITVVDTYGRTAEGIASGDGGSRGSRGGY